MKVVKSIHGDYGGIENLGGINRSSTWLECLKNVDQLKKKEVDLMAFVHKEVGKSDTWIWSLEASGLFSVASSRCYIDDILCAWEGAPTRWVNLVPKKFNALAWRLSLNKLPTRHNISLRGMDIRSILCPICEVNVEYANHLFFSCMLAREIYERIFKWCGLLVVTFSSYIDWLTWFSSLKIRKVIKDYLEGIFFVTWWHIWWFRKKNGF
uniref:RNA-directed DNA polymerase, eukaryota n=1 Tax=Tanacetum cinerariifolium TaxID=118510 RepID=A0A699HUR1_TANCI|nr:RNA-directed DNA polymerase, eukaryota [Tanacetum cinerariifolium]GEY62529.1 RNA-directed DNA polymerase, eukaryota [Tanacetum cinerariifolium]